MFSNRKMPEAPDFDENRKSIFLTCRSKIVAFCIATEYQCDSFQAVGSHIIKIPATTLEVFKIAHIRNWTSLASLQLSSKQAFTQQDMIANNTV